jgi:hypothetical protein
MWFLPVAHYDALGLDRFLLALADLLLTQGRWDEARFDQALFYQAAALGLGVTWLESQPATFEIRLPGGVLINQAGDLDESLSERERLGLSLNVAVDSLRAAGVRGDVTLEPFREVQGQGDHFRPMPVPRFAEVGPTGADRMPDAGGVFEVTDFDGSNFR